MLLVNNREAQLLKCDVLLQQRMRAYRHMYRSVRHALFHLLLLAAAGGSRKRRYPIA